MVLYLATGVYDVCVRGTDAAGNTSTPASPGDVTDDCTLLAVYDPSAGFVTGGGGVDRFRIKIWRIADGVIAYDNQMGASDTGDASTELGGGSVVIHTGGKK